MFWGFGAEFRATQWITARKFMLKERAVIGDRAKVINAELDRIGHVSMGWVVGDDGNATEQRKMLTITNPESSIAKLLQAYTVSGGNPFDISMFLIPSKGLGPNADGVVRRKQPGAGVVSLQSGAFAMGPFQADKAQQGDATVKLYQWARKGGPSSPEDPGDQIAIGRARRWIEKEIRFKRTDLERRIIKLCDLREQLQTELYDMAQAAGECFSVSKIPFSSLVFSVEATAASVAARFDGIFWTMVTDETTDIQRPNPNAWNSDALGSHLCLLKDFEGEEDTSL
jgi:hypothetical protein